MKVNIGLYQETTDKRDSEVILENGDVWCVCSTLCLIIEPLMRQYKECNDGFFPVSEAPEGLSGPDSHEWLVDEVIFAAYAINNDWESKYETYCCPEYDAESKRIQRGFELFGKYLQGFWT